MIVRQHKEIPVRYYFAAGAASLVLALAIFSVRMMHTETVQPTCEETYKRGVRFSYARSTGEALTADDLQAKLGGNDWGIADNVAFRKVDSAPSPVVLEVALKTGYPNADGVGRSGMGFPWKPRALEKAKAACMSYSVFVPDDFEFGTGGILPWLSGDGVELPSAPVADLEPSQHIMAKPFSVRVIWGRDGVLDVEANTQDLTRAHAQTASAPLVRLERGRWVKIEQEIVLNSTGQDDGLLRVWVDGVLGVDVSGVTFRADELQRMSQVNVDVHFANGMLQWVPALKSSALRLSPIDLRLE